MVDVAQLVRAPDCGSGGRRFEPDRLHDCIFDIAKRNGRVDDVSSRLMTDLGLWLVDKASSALGN